MITAIVVLDGGRLVLATEKIDASAMQALHDRLTKALPRWKILLLPGTPTVFDFRGDPELAAMADTMLEKIRDAAG